MDAMAQLRYKQAAGLLHLVANISYQMIFKENAQNIHYLRYARIIMILTFQGYPRSNTIVLLDSSYLTSF